MRTLFRLAMRIYPKAWLHRYGQEYAALLKDTGYRLGDLPDVITKGVMMRIESPLTLVVCSIAGVALGACFHILPAQTYRAFVEAQLPVAGLDLKQRALGVLCQPSLGLFIQSYNLYREMRENYPLEYVVAKMRREDIRVGLLPGNRVEVVFRYPDRLVAADVARDLAVELGLKLDREPTSMKLNRTWLFMPLGLLMGMALGLAVPKLVRLH